MKESMAAPEMIVTDFAKFENPGQCHIAFQALHQYQLRNNNALPRPHNKVRATPCTQGGGSGAV